MTQLLIDTSYSKRLSPSVSPLRSASIVSSGALARMYLALSYVILDTPTMSAISLLTLCSTSSERSGSREPDGSLLPLAPSSLPSSSGWSLLQTASCPVSEVKRDACCLSWAILRRSSSTLTPTSTLKQVEITAVKIHTDDVHQLLQRFAFEVFSAVVSRYVELLACAQPMISI